MTAKENPLDLLMVSKAEVVGAPGLRYSLGGAETGGVEADKILKDVEDDESIIRLQVPIACRAEKGLQGRTSLTALVWRASCPHHASAVRRSSLPPLRCLRLSCCFLLHTAPVEEPPGCSRLGHRPKNKQRCRPSS